MPADQQEELYKISMSVPERQRSIVRDQYFFMAAGFVEYCLQLYRAPSYTLEDKDHLVATLCDLFREVKAKGENY